MATLVETLRANWLIAGFGLILFLAGSSILYWNEGRAVHKTLALDETYDDVYSMQFTEEEQDKSFENRILHLTGPIICGEPLTEPDYNIQLMAVKLRRHVQMYQWVEEAIDSFGDSVDAVNSDTRAIYYKREWRDGLVDSRRFSSRRGHQNPQHLPIDSALHIADAVYIGKYELGGEVKNQFNKYYPLTSDIRPDDSSIKMHLGLYYHANNVFNPEVGDLRILFTYAGMEGDIYSVVGKLVGNKIEPYVTTHGVPVLLVQPGELNADELFYMEYHVQALHTWWWRFVGWLLIFFGVTCTSKILRLLLLRVPVLIALAPDLHFPVTRNFVLAFSMALTIAAIAWILHRPVIGACLLFAGASPYVWLTRNLVEYQRTD